MNDMGFLVVVVCNQPDIAKGRLSLNAHEKINGKMISGLETVGARLDGIYYCFHRHEDGCTCRKPKPGMLLKASHDLDVNLTDSYIVGDTIADIEAGKNAGCKTILIANPRLDLLKILHERGCEPDYIVEDLHHAVQLIENLEKTHIENRM
ncbi:MAG: HAD-IIIA family hydrolase [Candidatus Poribacteria bacterium]